jgi:hypothetical protein
MYDYFLVRRHETLQTGLHLALTTTAEEKIVVSVY